MAANVEQLCARCHGLVYNDWLAGTHGVRRGKWMEPAEFELQNFKCNECHDPHAPKFAYKNYTPPPVWPVHYVRHSSEPTPEAQTSE